TSTPWALLAVQGTSGSATDLFNVASSTGASQFIVKSSGNVGIGTATPTQALEVANGRIILTGSKTMSATVDSLLNFQTAVTNNTNIAISDIYLGNTFNG